MNQLRRALYLGALAVCQGCADPHVAHRLVVSFPAADDAYDVEVYIPEDLPPDVPADVLVFTDGDYWPRHRAQLRRAWSRGEVPPFVLIAVGYQGLTTGVAGGLGEATLVRRARDITEHPVDGWEGSGGARAFQGFLADELLPQVGEATGVPLTDVPSRRATFGFSAFGLAVTQGLLWGTDSGAGRCSASPSLRMFDEAVFAPSDDAQPGTLSGWALFTMGGEETLDAAALDDVLGWLDDGDQPALRVDREAFAGADHRAARAPAFAACLEAIGQQWEAGSGG